MSWYQFHPEGGLKRRKQLAVVCCSMGLSTHECNDIWGALQVEIERGLQKQSMQAELSDYFTILLKYHVSCMHFLRYRVYLSCPGPAKIHKAVPNLDLTLLGCWSANVSFLVTSLLCVADTLISSSEHLDNPMVCQQKTGQNMYIKYTPMRDSPFKVLA